MLCLTITTMGVFLFQVSKINVSHSVNSVRFCGNLSEFPNAIASYSPVMYYNHSGTRIWFIKWYTLLSRQLP